MADFPPPYTVRVSPRAKNVIIKLIPDKGIEVVLPKGTNRRDVPYFLEKRREWIEHNIRKLEQKGLSLSQPQLVLPDEICFVASGNIYTIRRVENRKPVLRMRRNVDKLLLSGSGWSPEEELKLLTRFVRSEARKFLVPELKKISTELNLPFSKAFIRAQRKRWGSCSAKGNINLNMKLMFLPYRLMRYVLIHELCHTVHLNHSAKYWRLVKMVEPNVEELEKELSEAGRLVPAWMNF
ncbi:M48 family metallopeptidase [Desulfovibrio sp. JC022]|uniref:M48 family metallopeptidase n=1 Tax=Desulfovibrio sp. JC022 TaxID=2593642 RepID=UPI0013D4F8D9|nr:SprT family zinc-dependent metalloprotease [Desulfovibrio sp. JC022]NDV22414.1 M48 family metallopeptidase [Desulfovibrio sp. JC022]